jgi:hypothetical protein
LGTERPAALFERCLNPKEEQADRRLQVVQIALLDGVRNLVLETACRADCGWA